MIASTHDLGLTAATTAEAKARWIGPGAALDRPATAAEAIAAARLDWDVIKLPLLAGREEYRYVHDRYAVVREDLWTRDGTGFLGIVGRNYTPLQNRDAFAFFDPVVGAGAAAYHAAGAIGEGEKVWMLAKLPGELRVIGDDVVCKYLLLSTSHDGTTAVQIRFIPIRLVCSNGLVQALRDGPMLHVTHTREVRERLWRAANMVNSIKARFEELGETFRRMASVRMNDQEAAAYLRAIFPDPRRAGDETRYARLLLQASRDREGAHLQAQIGDRIDLPGVRGTLWAFYNGVTAYIDHTRFRSSAPARRQDAIWFGDGYAAKVRAFRLAAQSIAAKR
jgi:phage/plasmid-like protein (TIGR03299 family)